MEGILGLDCRNLVIIIVIQVDTSLGWNIQTFSGNIHISIIIIRIITIDDNSIISSSFSGRSEKLIIKI